MQTVAMADVPSIAEVWAWLRHCRFVQERTSGLIESCSCKDFALTESFSRNGGVTRQPGLRRQTDRGVLRAEAAVPAPLHDLEKELILESLGVELKVLRAAVAVVEDVAGLEPPDLLGREVGARLEVVIIVFRDRQQLQAVGAKAIRRGKNVVARERDVLNDEPNSSDTNRADCVWWLCEALSTMRSRPSRVWTT